jgi:hypothetical protein
VTLNIPLCSIDENVAESREVEANPIAITNRTDVTRRIQTDKILFNLLISEKNSNTNPLRIKTIKRSWHRHAHA